MSEEKKEIGKTAELSFKHIKGSRLPTDLLNGNNYGIYIVKDGEGIYSVGARTFPFFSADMLIIPDGVNHTITKYSESIEAVCLAMPTGYLPEAVRCYFRKSAPVIRSEKALPELYRMLDMIETEYNGDGAFRKEKIKALVATLAITLARADNTYLASSEASPAVALTLAYITEHSSEKISLSDMAALAKVSAEYLSRKFKSEVGMGFADYLASFRLERARTMLKESPEMSITEIAFSTGFNDSNYFSDKFKRKFGISPLKYRNSDAV